MNSVPVYQYTIPLEQTEDGFEPAYDYPEGNEINKYEKRKKLIIIQDTVIPHFYKNSVAVNINMVSAGENHSS